MHYYLFFSSILFCLVGCSCTKRVGGVWLIWLHSQVRVWLTLLAGLWPSPKSYGQVPDLGFRAQVAMGSP